MDRPAVVVGRIVVASPHRPVPQRPVRLALPDEFGDRLEIKRPAVFGIDAYLDMFSALIAGPGGVFLLQRDPAARMVEDTDAAEERLRHHVRANAKRIGAADPGDADAIGTRLAKTRKIEPVDILAGEILLIGALALLSRPVTQLRLAREGRLAGLEVDEREDRRLELESSGGAKPLTGVGQANLRIRQVADLVYLDRLRQDSFRRPPQGNLARTATDALRPEGIGSALRHGFLQLHVDHPGERSRKVRLRHMSHMVQLDEAPQHLVAFELAPVLEDRKAGRIVEAAGQFPPLLVKDKAHGIGCEHLE